MNNLTPINGFKDYYISKTGFVYSNKSGALKKLKHGVNRGGYSYVNLCIDGKSYNKRIHRFIAETFITNEKDYLYVNHIDGNKSNNSVDNLEWCTSRENNTHLHLKRNTTSEFVGVYFDKNRNKWYSTIKHKGKQVFLGRHKTELEARDAYIYYCLENDINNRYAGNNSI